MAAAANGQRRLRKMANNVFVLNVFHLMFVCRASLDLRGRAFVQTDNELRYMVDTSVASSLHNLHDRNIPDVSVVRFEPLALNFNEQQVGMPFIEQVTVRNMDPETSLHLLSISGSTLHFHCSFFQDKLVPPLGNTTFEVVFLARQVGSVENTLYIHSSKGLFKYQVFGVGVQNPYRIRPFLGARVPVNGSFSPLIQMYNPHRTVLQVEEIYTSGGDLHLELPTGEQEAPKDLWEIPPFETKSIMKASFHGRVEHNHTAFIRIKTNKDNKQEMLVLPVEVEVTSAPGIYSPTELLDFGILRTLDEPRALRLSLINSGSESIQISNITVQPPNSAIHVDFRPAEVKPDVSHPTSVALISFTASLALLSVQWNGKIMIESKNSQYKLTIPYQAHVLHGSLVYDRNETMFYAGELPPAEVTRDLSITNTFNFTVVVYNVSVHPNVRSLFTVTNFNWPCSIGPQQSHLVFSLTFHPNCSMLHFASEIFLYTNASVFKIPLHVYNGRLKVINQHQPEIFGGQLNFGTMAASEKRTINFTVRNDNPIDIVISNYYSNMEQTVLSLLGVENGSGTTLGASHNSSKLETNSLVLKPYHVAVFSLELNAPDREGTFSSEVIISTQFERLYVPVMLVTVTGDLRPIPDKLVLTSCSPIGQLFSDRRRECRDGCYVTLPTPLPAGSAWLLGSTLDKEATDMDQYLFTRFRQKQRHLETSQTSIINVTLELATNQVRGFSFPNLLWPTVVKRPKIKFHLTQIGNASIREFVLENPADVPVVVHVVPFALYPDARTLIDTIGSFLPPDIAQGRLELDDGDVFSLRSHSKNQNFRSFGGPPLISMRRHAKTSLGVHANESTLAFVLPSRAKVPVEVVFQPKDNVLRNTLFIIRNNLTIIETVLAQGQGGMAELRFSNRKPGSQKPFLFEMTEKHLRNCDEKTHGKTIHPSLTVKRTFTLRNTGQLPLYLHNFYIGNLPCEGFGFKILDCTKLDLPPNASHKVDIVFTPDFTMSRIQQILTLHTSLGPTVNFSLQATIPTHMLTQCAAALPRPTWEPFLYYSVLFAMGFLLLCVVLVAYLDTERIFIIDVIRRRSELGRRLAFNKSKASANFRPPNSSSRISSNLCTSKSLAAPPIAKNADVNGHLGTGKSPSGAFLLHRQESWWSRVLCALSFRRSSMTTEKVVGSTQQASSDVTKHDSVTGVTQNAGTTSMTSVTNERTVRKMGFGKSLLKHLCELYVIRLALRRIWNFIIPKRFTSNSPKSSVRPSGDQTKDLNVADAGTNLDQSIPSSLTLKTQKKNSDQEHQKRQLEAKPVMMNKENYSASQSAKSSAGNNAPTPVNNEQTVNQRATQKSRKVRKMKTSGLKRVNKKLSENEKVDKDDSSSTATETSSTEADEKNASPRCQENEDKDRTKKIHSKTHMENAKSVFSEDAATIPCTSTGVVDEFLFPTVKQTSKSSRKSKSTQNQNFIPNAQKSCSPEPSTAIKHDPTAALKETKPKQVCPPLNVSEAVTSSTSAAYRKKTSKARVPGIGLACDANRCFLNSYHYPSSSPAILWDMPCHDCKEHDGLSELAAQTDLFARTYSSPVTAASKPTHELAPCQPNRSSYSSVASSLSQITNHQNYPQIAVSKTTRPKPDGLLAIVEPSSEEGSLNAYRQHSNALISMPAAGGMSSRPASNRPVAAVGATVRRPWPGSFSHGHYMSDNNARGMFRSGTGETDLPMAYGNRLLFDDPAIMAGFGLNPSCFPQEGYDLYGYGPSMISNPVDHHQQTNRIQRIQAERRMQRLRYEQKKNASGTEWLGFDLPTTVSSDPWEQRPLLSSNPWSPLPSDPLRRVSPSSGHATIWNTMGTTAPDCLGWTNSIWSNPEPQTKLTSPGPYDPVEAVDVNSSAGGGGATATHSIFDPFDVLEIRTGGIWTPTSTGSSTTGWGFGMNRPGEGGGTN